MRNFNLLLKLVLSEEAKGTLVGLVDRMLRHSLFVDVDHSRALCKIAVAGTVPKRMAGFDTVVTSYDRARSFCCVRLGCSSRSVSFSRAAASTSVESASRRLSFLHNNSHMIFRFFEGENINFDSVDERIEVGSVVRIYVIRYDFDLRPSASSDVTRQTLSIDFGQRLGSLINKRRPHNNQVLEKPAIIQIECL